MLLGALIALFAVPAMPVAAASAAPAAAAEPALPPVVQVPMVTNAKALPAITEKALMPTTQQAAANAAAGAAGACPSSSCEMTYHGGPVQTSPKVRITFAGTQWNNNFDTGYGITRDQYWNYIAATMRYGGSGYVGTATEYCQGVASGTVNCGGSGTHITNPLGQWDGVIYIYQDPNPPTSPGDSYIQGAADSLRQYLHGTFGSDLNENLVVFTLPNHNTPGFGSSFCAWHSSYFYFWSLNYVAFTNMPFIPQAYGSCGRNIINGTDSFGHGSQDGVSIVGMHEVMETITDPKLDAWYDTNGTGEIGDKCAWQNIQNMKWSGQYMANQPEWSNTNFGCVFNQFPSVSQSPSSYNWGNVRVNTNGSVITFYETNTGNADLFPTNYLFTADSSFFVYTNACSGQRIVPGGYCYFQLYSHPFSMGVHNATFWQNHSTIGYAAYGLSVNGVAPVISVGPGLSYGNVVIGTASDRGMTVRNVGTFNLTVSSASTPSGFSAVGGGSCPAMPFVLGPGGACNQNIRFGPTDEANYSGNVVFGSDSFGGTNFAGVSGTGEPLLISPASDNFGFVKLGSSSSTMDQTITNKGPNPITINDIQPAGADQADFSEVDSCNGLTLNTGDSCVITSQFTPSRQGTENASWNVLTTAITGTHNLPLTGTGALGAVTFRPSSLNFPDTTVGNTSSEMQTTVINSGPVPLNIASVATGGGNPLDYAISTDTCSGTTLNPGDTCLVGVTFAPTDVGARPATADVTSDDASGLDSAALNGNGLAPPAGAPARAARANVH